MNRFARNDSPRRKWTVRSTGDSGWLYTNDDSDEREDSFTDLQLTEFRQGPRRIQADDEYEDEEDWAEEDDWDDAGDFDEYDDDDYDWEDDEEDEEDPDEW